MNKTTRRKGTGRVAFLARIELFREMLKAGHPQRSIYDDHAAALGISYSQFNRYISRYLPNDGHQKRAINVATDTTQPATESQSDNTSQKPSFTHNPNSGNDRDDLI